MSKNNHPKGHSEPSQLPNMEVFAKIILKKAAENR